MAVDSVATAKPAAQSEGNVKETVESILVAFILAFIFRAFIVEAFVIPTGSMAPTLYGAHMRFRCPDCGYVFDVGYSATGGTEEEPNIPTSAFQPVDYHCPNCGYTVPATNASRGAIERPVRFGDRILVLKYLYLFEKPQRGDTVVFKSPEEGAHHNPIDPEYSVNYIKRLVGIGPETIMLLDGDVYHAPLGTQDFKIWRKPQHVQNVLWRNVFDNDFIPHLADADREHPWAQPWQEQSRDSGWKLGRTRVFSFDRTSGAGTIAFQPAANPDTRALTDYLVYDEKEHSDSRYEWPSRARYISDLKLACTYTRKSGDGPLRMVLTKNDDCFTAEIAAGKVTLLRSHIVSRSDDGNFKTDGEQVMGAPVTLSQLSVGKPVRLELVNVDYRVSVRVEGREVIATRPEDYQPDVQKLRDQAAEPSGEANVRPNIQITANQQSCELEHVQLARDIYYLNNRPESAWGSPRRPVDLKQGEYFVLGDNSFISGDARYWGEPIRLPQEGIDVESGRVPEQFMLGKAFFVYWPAGYRLPGTYFNIVPDFGDMRFIH